MPNYITPSERIFLLKFRFAMGKQIMCEQKHIVEALRDNVENGGIEFIKEYNPAKQTFQRVSKKQLRLYFDWDTVATKELEKNHLL